MLINSAKTAGGASGGTTSGIDTTGANFIVIAIAHDAGGTPSVSDNKGNTYTEIGTPQTLQSYLVGRMYYCANANVGTGHTFTVSGASTFSSLVAEAHSDIDTSAPLDQNNGSTADSTTIQPGSVTPSEDDELIITMVTYGYAGGVPASINLSFSKDQEQDFGSGTNYGVAIAHLYQGSAAAVNPTWTPAASVGMTAKIATFKTVPSATLNQEGFAFGDDDGNEASHTLDTQDTDFAGDPGVKTLRALIDMEGSAAAFAFKLKYQKNGAGGYADVPVGAISPGQAGAVEAADITESGTNTAGDPWSVAHPNAVAGDLLIFNIGWDDSTNVTTLTPPAGPNGETAVVIEDVVASASTAVRGKIVYYIATGTWTAGTISFDPNASEQWTAMCVKVPAGEFDPSTPIGAHSNEPSTGTGDAPVTSDLSAGASDGGGRVLSFIVFDTSITAGSISGWTPVLTRDRGAVAVGLYGRDALATDSESIAEGTGLGTGVNWVSFSYIIRPPADTSNELYISTSGNVTGGGEATTARLTPPTGKSTSAFGDGRRWDDENGSDSVSITGDDGYTELEWVLTVTEAAEEDDYYEFRVYKGNAALQSYSVTPKWTIGTGSPPAENTTDFFQLF